MKSQDDGIGPITDRLRDRGVGLFNSFEAVRFAPESRLDEDDEI